MGIAGCWASKTRVKWPQAGGKVFIGELQSLVGLIVAVISVSYFSNAAAGFPVIPIAALVLAGLIWLIGWTLRKR